MGKLDGRCMCGSITYSCDADPGFTAICHCADCQRQTGTAFSVVVGVPDEALQISGDTLSSYTTVGEDSQADTVRNFCSACGSPIVTRSDGSPGVAVLKAGTLEDPSWLEPQIEVWGRSAHPYGAEVEARPRMERGPPAPSAA